MSYLLDTNVLSETIKVTPNQSVLNWVQSVPSESIYISVITIGEIRKGIEKLETSHKKEKILTWLEHSVPDWFDGRILPIDFDVCDRWGYITGSSEKTLAAIDSLIAATALTHNLKLVTRNVSDFPIPGLEVINPWNYELT